MARLLAPAGHAALGLNDTTTNKHGQWQLLTGSFGKYYYRGHWQLLVGTFGTYHYHGRWQLLTGSFGKYTVVSGSFSWAPLAPSTTVVRGSSSLAPLTTSALTDGWVCLGQCTCQVADCKVSPVSLDGARGPYHGQPYSVHSGESPWRGC